MLEQKDLDASRAIMKEEITESENLILEEMEHTRKILDDKISQVQKNMDELNNSYKITTNAEVIENLARKLERARILNDLRECKTLEDFQEITKKYEALCNEDKN